MSRAQTLNSFIFYRNGSFGACINIVSIFKHVFYVFLFIYFLVIYIIFMYATTLCVKFGNYFISTKWILSIHKSNVFNYIHRLRCCKVLILQGVGNNLENNQHVEKDKQSHVSSFNCFQTLAWNNTFIIPQVKRSDKYFQCNDSLHIDKNRT